MRKCPDTASWMLRAPSRRLPSGMCGSKLGKIEVIRESTDDSATSAAMTGSSGIERAHGRRRADLRHARSGEGGRDRDHAVDPVLLVVEGEQLLADESALAVRHDRDVVQVAVDKQSPDLLGGRRDRTAIEAELRHEVNRMSRPVQRLGDRPQVVPGLVDTGQDDDRALVALRESRRAGTSCESSTPGSRSVVG